MELPDHAAKMIRDYIEIQGDPFEPYSSTNLAAQTKEWKCNGCRAIGHSKWPEWKLEVLPPPQGRYATLNECEQLDV